MYLCETETPKLRGRLFVRLLCSSACVPIAAGVRLSHVREHRLGAQVDTYRHQHPRCRREGRADEWLSLLQERSPGELRAVRLDRAPRSLLALCGAPGEQAECLPAEDRARVRELALRPQREAAERRALLTRVAPGGAPSPVEPAPGEGWIELGEALALALSCLFDGGDLRAEALHEIETDEHERRETLAEILADLINSRSSPIVLLDARSLPLDELRGVEWLGRVLSFTGERAILIALPPHWCPSAQRSAAHLWPAR